MVYVYTADSDCSSDYTVIKCGGNCCTVTQENREICDFDQVE